jgi:hypothetical protein
MAATRHLTVARVSYMSWRESEHRHSSDTQTAALLKKHFHVHGLIGVRSCFCLVSGAFFSGRPSDSSWLSDRQCRNFCCARAVYAILRSRRQRTYDSGCVSPSLAASDYVNLEGACAALDCFALCVSGLIADVTSGSGSTGVVLDLKTCGHVSANCGR